MTIESNIPPAAEPDYSGGTIFGHRRVTQFLVILMAIVSCIIFSYGARWIHWPAETGFRGSLAQPPVALGGFLAAIILLTLCTALATWILGRRWFLAGLLVATAGLATWSVRGGSTVYVLMCADDSGAGANVFIQMTVELIVLFGVIAGFWSLIWTRHHSRAIEPRENASRETTSPLAVALIAQIALMIIFTVIFVATTQKKQVLAGVFLAGLFSTAITEQAFGDSDAGRWYWIGPLAAGIFGYIANRVSPGGLVTGDLTGLFAPLGRVLPLDYASLGSAGALLGYWWMMPADLDLPEPE